MTDQKYKDLMNGGWSYPKKESTDPEEVKKVVDKYLTDNKIDSETIDKKITDGISKIVADAPEDFDTLKEMSDWISQHSDSAAAMNSDILDNKSSIETLQKDKANATDVETLSSEVENNTNDISEINDSIKALGKCKNLLKTTLGSGTGNGITYVNNGDGSFTLSGTCTNTFELHFNSTLKLPYGKYKLLGTSAFQKDNNGAWKATLASGNVFEVSESKPVLDVIAYITSGSVVDKTFKPMVTANLNATEDDFVPYTGDGDTLTADVAKMKNDVDAINSKLYTYKTWIGDGETVEVPCSDWSIVTVIGNNAAFYALCYVGNTDYVKPISNNSISVSNHVDGKVTITNSTGYGMQIAIKVERIV